jgi:hypothetical protein
MTNEHMWFLVNMTLEKPEGENQFREKYIYGVLKEKCYKEKI